MRAQPVAVAPPEKKVERSPFEHHDGKPIDLLRDYAVGYWGPNGVSTFTSAASVRRAGDLVLVEVGRYAVVETDRGFFVRDFGEAGWVTMMKDTPPWIEVRYTIRDPRSDEDWKGWRGRRVPQITSVAHMIVELWSFADRARPRVAFAHEYEAWANCCGSEIGLAPPRVSDDYTVTATEVRMRAREAWRATRASWQETPLAGIDPVLAPWDEPREVTFALTGRSASSPRP